MSAFQILLVTLLVLISVFTVDAAARGHIRKRIGLFWLLVWGSAGTAIVWPESTVRVARWLGIGRGADLVLYLSVFVMLGGFFYTYTRFRRLDRQITLLVRRLAVQGARSPAPARLPDEPAAGAES